MYKRRLWKTILTGVMAAMMVIAPMGALAEAGVEAIVVEGFDWGPAVTKVVVALEGAVAPDSIDPAAITVGEHKQILDFQNMTTAEGDYSRTILNAYVSDAEGNKVDQESTYVAVEMAVSPTEGSPFFYDYFATGHNMWADPYELTVEVNGAKVSGAPAKRIMPQADLFQGPVVDDYDGISLSYSFYAPDGEGKKPLIIWLHGAGEGGSDPAVVQLGNKVVALAGEKIQGYFDGGAWVLCPQSPTMWMDNGDKDPETGAPVYVNDENHVSIYTESLKKLIDNFVAEHGDAIDTDKIIVGGCSNGGFMTVNMVMHYPEMFAAAYPICEAYVDKWISDEDLAKLATVPAWYTYAKNDTTVDPTLNAAPTVERLKAAGADVQVTAWENVVDMTGLYKDAEGNAYEYMGHWSWLYALNDECVEELDGGQVSIWQWLANKVK